MKYFLRKQNQVLGPFPLDELRRRLQTGELSTVDLVCAEGWSNWTPLSEVLHPDDTRPVGPAAAAAKRRKVFGCGGCFVSALVLIALVVAGGLTAIYYAVFHSVLPIRLPLALIPNLKVSGATGTIASGFAIRSLKWTGSAGQECEIDDVRLKYDGFLDYADRHEIIVNEINLGKVRVIVDSSNWTYTDTRSQSYSARNNGSRATPMPIHMNPQDRPRLVRVDRVHFGNVYLKDTNTGFEFSMPDFDYNGFKWENGKFDLGDLHVDSDRLALATKPGRTAQIDGKTVVYNKMIEGTIKPLLGKAIKEPISFVADVGINQDKLFFRYSAFEDKVEVIQNADGSGSYRTDDFSPDRYFSAPPYDLPTHVTVEAKFPEKSKQAADKIQPPKGHFTLGVCDFVIDEAETPVFTQGDKQIYEIKARHKTESGAIVLTLRMTADKMEAQPLFTSDPVMEPTQLLAQVFYGKNYAELSPEEKTGVDSRIAVYFPIGQPADKH